MIGCDCAVCASPDPKNQRMRTSIALVTPNGGTIVVDTTPEFRLQMTRNGLKQLSGVLYTHSHADHCHGFDDLRAICFHTHQPVTCYLAAELIPEFRQRFSYAFTDTGYQGIKPRVELLPMPSGPFEFGGLTIEPVRLPHGATSTVGFRCGKFAYATDFKDFPRETIAAWRGKVEIMVASGIHFGTHSAHSVIPETIALFEALAVKRGILTHLAHDVDYIRDRSRLPPQVEFGYDGLSVELS